MKIGSENRTKLIVAAVLGILAIALIANWLFSSGSSSSAAATPSPVASRPLAAAVAGNGTGGKKSLKAERSLDPTLRLGLLKESEDTKYEGKGRNIFRA